MMSPSPGGHSLKIGILRFPGSNCDIDCANAFSRHFGASTQYIWHSQTSLPQINALVIPGGFSFGDYMRSGALAARAPIMEAVRDFVRRGGPVLGICNGFQILTESGLLPGALLGNLSQTFICKDMFIRDQNGRVKMLPIAHGEGRYWISEKELSRLEGEGQIAFQYCSPTGVVSAEYNPNGSAANIAAVYSKSKKVLGMMPHPERATESFVGKTPDGLAVMADFLRQI